MSFFFRNRLSKANPYRDAEGKFTTAEYDVAGSLGNVSGGLPKSAASVYDDRLEKFIPDIPEGKYGPNTLGQALYETAKTRNISVDDLKAELTAKLTEEIKNANVYTRTTESVLSKIITEGEFKNQYETNASRGYLSPGLRQRAEETLFGLEGRQGYHDNRDSIVENTKNLTRNGRKMEYEPSHLTPEQAAARPIYGYLANSAEFSNEGLDQYGDVAVEFKPSMREVSTFTTGDSLDTFAHGEFMPTNKYEYDEMRKTGTLYGPVDHARMGFSPVNNPSYRSAKSNFGQIFDKKMESSYDYYEAQIFRKPKVSDISRVVFTKEPSKTLQGKLKKVGIPWSVKGAK